jgi:hypothetical protein
MTPQRWPYKSTLFDSHPENLTPIFASFGRWADGVALPTLKNGEISDVF